MWTPRPIFLLLSLPFLLHLTTASSTLPPNPSDMSGPGSGPNPGSAKAMIGHLWKEGGSRQKDRHELYAQIGRQYFPDGKGTNPPEAYQYLAINSAKRSTPIYAKAQGFSTTPDILRVTPALMAAIRGEPLPRSTGETPSTIHVPNTNIKYKDTADMKLEEPVEWKFITQDEYKNARK
ncbi:hypothetical protein IWQ60_003749 [Tieghemiomyces parasiticus]|uniref:Uncharacterized protein n=1 Tax=Tieghemiomyces parasiticus TaxID=78921 RepID=A0A9W8A9R0_9FUNG|nr:hypothetical protein IWQ60_003749 [Tieghemiomyces parasiticus]